MDALTDILRSVRMTGSVFSRAALTAPWGVESGKLESGIFHAVVRGRAWVRLADGGDPVVLDRGDIVFFPFGSNHLMTDTAMTPTKPIGLLTSVDERGMGRLVVDGGGAATSLICGRVTYDRAEAHPVFSSLPPMIHVGDEDGRIGNVVESLIALIANEVDRPVAGTDAVVARLTDVLTIYILRSYINSLGAGEGGWLGALADEAIADALGLIHADPTRQWTADELARAAGLSRSAFFARFRHAVGETPAGYLTRWRIHIATRLLREQGASAAAAGRRVGYKTEAAFSNAFLRVMGMRPGAYKRSA